MKLFSSQPTIALGKYRSWIGNRTLCVKPQTARVHTHVLGKTGSGKSYFLASLFLSLYNAGMPATLIDPHGDLAELVLTHLIAQGTFDDPEKKKNIIYLDVPRAAAQNKFIPFNYLAQPYDDYAMAELVAEASRRAWPELATGAPTFENILKHSVIALRQNNLPLTALSDFLTDNSLRNTLLQCVSDSQVIRFFKARMDQWGREAPLMKESTLNRADLLTLSPVLRYSLGHKANFLNFRDIIDEGKTVIINLALPHPDARRLFGCLLTVGMENAALSRANVAASERGPSHHLILDEFSQFMAQSEESLTRMLSETRKYNMFCVMAHQNWSQASDRLKGALQNVGLEVILKAGRSDAEYSSRLFGSVDPLSVKHTVADGEAEDRTHPTYYPLQEQWEEQVQAIQRLDVGEAFIRLPSDSVKKVKTMRLPQINVNSDKLAEIHDYYLKTYFQNAQSFSETELSPPIYTQAPIISRRGKSPPPAIDKYPTSQSVIFSFMKDTYDDN